jgi:hypothetical protein
MKALLWERNFQNFGSRSAAYFSFSRAFSAAGS